MLSQSKLFLECLIVDLLNCLFFLVMALYPQTTCFYKAIINNLPESATADYELLFEDASYPEGYSPPLMVAQRYVIAFKHTKKSGNTSS